LCRLQEEQAYDMEILWQDVEADKCRQTRDGPVGTWAFSFAFGRQSLLPCVRTCLLTRLADALVFTVVWVHTSAESSLSIWILGPMNSFRVCSSGATLEPTCTDCLSVTACICLLTSNSYWEAKLAPGHVPAEAYVLNPQHSILSGLN
jgi:hypothetical protein